MSRIQNIRWFDLHFCNLFIFKKENLQFDKEKKKKRKKRTMHLQIQNIRWFDLLSCNLFVYKKEKKI